MAPKKDILFLICGSIAAIGVFVSDTGTVIHSMAVVAAATSGGWLLVRGVLSR